MFKSISKRLIVATAVLLAATACGGQPSSDMGSTLTPSMEAAMPTPAELVEIDRPTRVLRPGGTLRIGEATYILVRHERREADKIVEDGFYMKATAPEPTTWTEQRFGIDYTGPSAYKQVEDAGGPLSGFSYGEATEGSPKQKSLTGLTPLYGTPDGGAPTAAMEGWIVFISGRQEPIDKLYYSAPWLDEQIYWDMAAEPTGDFRHG